MSLESISRVAVQVFNTGDAPTMVAIAGAESGFNPAARGDAVNSFPPSLANVYQEWSDEGFCSFGAWQVFLPVHHQMVATLSHKETPAELASWLLDAENNARAAREILGSQGFTAWSTFNDSQFHRFINDAGVGVAAALDALANNIKRAIVAISLASPHAHIDLDDDSFIDLIIHDVGLYGEWLRFNLDHQVVIDAFQNSR